MSPRYAIRLTCTEGTRHWWWAGVCPMSGRVIWSGDRSRAVRLAEGWTAARFRDAVWLCHTGAPGQYEVVNTESGEVFSQGSSP